MQQDDRLAFQMFQESERHPGSALYLGFMHLRGIATPRDYLKAAAYFERADNAGYSDATNELAHMYRDGLGVPRDPQRADQLWRKAAEAGHAGEQVEIGLVAYQRQNMGDARDWWRRSASQGNAIAKRNLAHLIMEGPRQQRNEAEAFRLFLEAAEGGDRVAMRQIAACYATGMLVDRNLAEAERWLLRLLATNDPSHMEWGRQYLSDVRGLKGVGFFLPRRTPWDQADRDVENARGDANRARSDAQQEIWRERHMNMFQR
jgi:TPR repeat protein